MAAAGTTSRGLAGAWVENYDVVLKGWRLWDNYLVTSVKLSLNTKLAWAAGMEVSTKFFLLLLALLLLAVAAAAVM